MSSKTRTTDAPHDQAATVAVETLSVNADSNIFAQAASLASVGLAITDAHDGVLYVNEAFATLLGIAVPPAEGHSLSEWFASIMPGAYAPLAPLLARPGNASLNVECRDGRMVTLHIGARGAATRLISATQTARPEANGKSPVYCDPLTDLGNRQSFENILSQWAPFNSQAQPLAVIMIDLDRFSQINDTLGHAIGDALLKLVARRLNAVTHAEDTVFRLGGDEFAILHLPCMQHGSTESLARRIVELLSRPFLIEGQQVNIGASVGISVLHFGTQETDNLLKHAELALYAAKAAGRGTFRFFESHLEARALERREMELNLRRALGLKEFKLVYQPQVCLATRQVCGFEALIRWDCAQRGLISPTEFIPLAEEIGEIHHIGEWVLRTACQEAASWDNEMTISVNVSPLQFESDSIVATVWDALTSTGLAPERLELEITEGVLIGNSEAIMQRLWEIRDMGVGIAMDDFGTGYSSLSYLNSFPFSQLKIDQSFIRGEQSQKSRALVEAILTLGSSLGMATLAEGVETQIQFETLARSGCEKAQGYLIARPMPPEEIGAFCLTQHSRPCHPSLQQ
ncbi:putative bifunctional diguanylate cyclase/phosphodiesterase [Halomonas sp. WWR20]